MTNQKAVKIVMFGAFGGIIASIAMYPFLFLTTSMMGLPLDDLSIARGMAISNINDNYYLNLTLGIVMHLLTGAIAGVIFTIIVSTVKKFAIIDFKRGIIEGVIYSIIVFLVLFIPTTLGMVLPNLFDIMNLSNPNQSNFEDRQTIEHNLIPIYGFGFIAHIVFGIILGLVTTLLIFRRFITLKN
ncbi:MAG TPA: hypothetical protein VJU13_06170 [Candidatus Nitrosocosmicus sp.]|jgi:hypothetical protein|nr:hypothetical protein [Candidatus Nitrosocosmicus sp.]